MSKKILSMFMLAILTLTSCGSGDTSSFPEGVYYQDGRYIGDKFTLYASPETWYSTNSSMKSNQCLLFYGENGSLISIVSFNMDVPAEDCAKTQIDMWKDAGLDGTYLVRTIDGRDYCIAEVESDSICMDFMYINIDGISIAVDATFYTADNISKEDFTQLTYEVVETIELR